MAAPVAGRLLQIFPRLSLRNSPPIRDTALHITPACSCRFVGNIRNKADQMKDGYGPQDSIFRNKTKEEVILELLSHAKKPEKGKTRSDYCKEYALKGEASGVDPSIMWPTKAELQQLRDDESYYCSSLEEMQAELHLEKKRKELYELRKEKHIEKCLAEMPKIEEEYRREEEAKRLKEEESRKKRAELLELARAKLGYAIDPRDVRFRQMVQEMEEEERKRKKALKRRGIVG